MANTPNAGRKRRSASSSDIAPTTPAPTAISSQTTGFAGSPKGKLGAVAVLLRRPEGASLVQMAEVTGWQAHSIRGAISGALKRKHGFAVSSEKTEFGRVYRIAGEPA